MLILYGKSNGLNHLLIHQDKTVDNQANLGFIFDICVNMKIKQNNGMTFR